MTAQGALTAMLIECIQPETKVPTQPHSAHASLLSQQRLLHSTYWNRRYSNEYSVSFLRSSGLAARSGSAALMPGIAFSSTHGWTAVLVTAPKRFNAPAHPLT